MKLHIGGKEVKEGWKILNIQQAPGVDYLGDISNLQQFPDRSIDEIYASHVLEHVSQADMPKTLVGLYRVLKRGGRLLVSVPDMDVLCRLFIAPGLDHETKYQYMGMIFGGQMDAYDFHRFGWSFDFMRFFLEDIGFMSVQKVERLGLFRDTSEQQAQGELISLNIIAVK